jgi:hypothetical protein
MITIDKLTEEQAKGVLTDIKNKAENSEDARDFILWVLELFKQK